MGVPGNLADLPLKLGVSAVIIDGQGRVLLQRRADNGLWALPGGAVDPNESVSEAVHREVLEETGLEIRVERLVGVYTDPRVCIARGADGRWFRFIAFSFLARPTGGSLRLSSESTDLAYFSPQHLPPDLFPLHRIRIEDALADREAAFVR